VRPGSLRFALDREVHLAEPGDGVEEFGVGEADGSDGEPAREFSSAILVSRRLKAAYKCGR
jgi:hypothetical protein